MRLLKGKLAGGDYGTILADKVTAWKWEPTYQACLHVYFGSPAPMSFVGPDAERIVAALNAQSDPEGA